MLGEKTKLNFSNGVINPLLELEDFELDGFLLDDAFIPTVAMGVLLVEFASQYQITTTLEGDVLSDKKELACLVGDPHVEKGIAKLYMPPVDQEKHL